MEIAHCEDLLLARISERSLGSLSVYPDSAFVGGRFLGFASEEWAVVWVDSVVSAGNA